MATIDKKVEFLHGFSHKTRIEILYYLIEKERSVSQILTAVDTSQSSVSQHIACLKGCGLISGRQEGKYIYYQLRNDKIKELLLNIDDVIKYLPSNANCQNHIV
ncbi:ArsR/SmtB family transcription factor [Jeotgalicoccus sp. FSL K6-3177]|uniref:ArsR/SmtB family transcription factor n=1 Tax=Jeotgalicoccus sp. FSL K6-3177 TaxID=2921494 RepID=UPI0030FD6B32